MKRKKKSLDIINLTLLLTTVLFVLLIVFMMLGQKDDEIAKETATESLTILPQEKTVVETFMHSVGEMRAVWIATVGNINFPTEPGLSADELKAQIDDILLFCTDNSLNTVFFQVRPSSDSVYNSSIFPTSAYLCENQGDDLSGGFDPYLYLIRSAHARGIAVFAWINPLRVTTSEDFAKGDLSNLAKTNPAYLHPEWCVEYVGNVYYNPGIPEVRELVADSVAEIVSNYDTDGVVFDDYFYPYPKQDVVYNDKKEYQRYGYGSSLEDWRRQNVNDMIKLSYDTVKSINKDCYFGVSPFGIWQNNDGSNNGSDTAGLSSYDAIYCDALAWVKGGYVDFLSPQLYWNFDYDKAPFATLCDWWDEQLKGSKTSLLISHGAYRVSEWKEDEILHQVEYARSKSNYMGSAFYGFAALKINENNIADRLSAIY